MSARRWAAVHVFLAVVLLTGRAHGQVLSQRGFVEGRFVVFPQEAVNDPTRAVGDLLVRDEAFLAPKPWLRLAGGIELRANSHDQVDDSWRLDFSDRGVRRPRVSVRRATATLTRGRFTVDVGKQFIRWGTADIVNPTDRFAPRDFLNVLDADFLPVTGVRAVVTLGGKNSVEAVWVPSFTPSRMPLPGQRWTVISVDPRIPIVDVDTGLPDGSQRGFRWRHVGDRVEYALSFYDGFNHLPNIEFILSQTVLFAPEVAIRRVYAPIRSFGGDAALPTRWFTLKAEAAYFTTPSSTSDEFALYVIQVERQTGEWVLIGGYAGEVVTERRAPLTFAPDRGVTRSLLGRASYTIDANRSVAFETAVRQNAAGAYAKAEYSQAYGQHWRATAAGALIRGEPEDFLGQYRRNSHLSLTLRYSF
jgi:hypothetical protein